MRSSLSRRSSVLTRSTPGSSVPQDSIFNDRIKQLAQQNKLPVLVEGGDPDWVKNVVIPNGLAYDLTDWIDATPAIKDVLIDDSREYCSNEDGRGTSHRLLLQLCYVEHRC